MVTVHAQTIYTGKTVLKDAYITFRGRSIVSISKRRKGKISGSYPVITPAFIDPHAHIGMCRAGEPGSEGESNEHLDSMFVLCDALDSVQMDDGSFKDSVESGVLYSCVVPGSGNIIGGRSAVIRNYAETTTDAFIQRAGIKAAFGYNPMSVREWKGKRPYTRMGALALLRGRLDAVRRKMYRYDRAGKKARADILFSAEDELIQSILQGRERLRVHAHKTDDIAALLRIVDEFKLKISVEHACDVHDPIIFEVLKKRRIPVVYGPVESFARKVELKHESWRNIRHLISSGVTFGLMTDHPVILQRLLLISLRWFLRCGLTKQQAIEIITRNNAGILGVNSILGTLEKGKWASFVCWNGDPFELSNYPVRVVGEGQDLIGDIVDP
jgi:imidazolonepropionase-like amidohydrolase